MHSLIRYGNLSKNFSISLEGLMNMIKSICLALLVSFLPLIASAQEREISVKGLNEFKILVVGQTLTIKGGEFDGAKSVKTPVGFSLVKKDGSQISSIRPGYEKSLELLTGDTVQFLIQLQDQGYSVVIPNAELLNRVKVKEDKFNLYDKAAARLLHGKQKEDGFGVKDEKGEQVLKIKGVTTLREASWFALQIPVSLQVMGWANENVK